MRMRSIVIACISILCALSLRGQNVWIENNADHFGCIPDDSIRLQIFDPYSYSRFDSIKFNYGDADFDYLIIDSSNNTDTVIFHAYPGCGYFSRDFENFNYKLKGVNIADTSTSYYLEHRVAFETPSMFYYDKSPTFDLKYEIIRCKNVSFNLNAFRNELNGDSLYFELVDNNGSVPIPDGVSINPSTGELFWDSQPDTGLYHFIMYVTETRFGSHLMGRYMARFSIKVTDSCQAIIAHDNIDNKNLFETQGREFNVLTNQPWNYSFRIAKGDWDSISVKPSSEIFEHSFFDSDHSVTDIGDSLEMSVSWTTDSIHKRNYPYIITYHVTAFKNYNTHHRVLTNAISVDWPLGMKTLSQRDGYFSIHPNPTTERVTITATSNIERIELLNTSGLRIEDYAIPETTSSDIELKDVPNGLYFLRITTEKISVTKSVVKTIY